ncbi:MAG: cadmium-translocating P-type ATPase [Anaerolineaceae bacterium]|nr:cadmium-translocating P-type ATPase [Anaerolineaceae bacterium]
MAEEKTIQLDLALVLPAMDSADECVNILTDRLVSRKGIEKAHIVRENGSAQLCLHFDPNVISLAELKRLAQDSGVQVTDRYRHEQLPFTGLNTADAAQVLERSLERISGVLHASVNYAAGLLFIAYDNEVVQQDTIEQVVRQSGARILERDHRQTIEEHSEEGHEGHDHGSAPGFLPHWIQERWTLFLVGLAGVFFAIGFVGETFLGMTEGIATLFFILAYVAGGYDIATHAIPGLFRGEFDTDVLMLAAAGGAAILGEWAEGAFLLFLFSLGHAGEHYALDRARRAVNALGELMPKTAQVRRGNEIVEELVENLQIDDVVIVRPGDRIPVDGEISNGTTTVDQSPITGESVPVNKSQGDGVFAGTINQDNAIDVRVTKLARDNTLSRVMQMVAEAQSQQSPTQRFTQRFTARFVPAVLIGTFLLIVIPSLLNLSTFQDNFYRGMLLLVAASPCALAIGTPAAVLSGIAQAARNGVLIKGGVHLENLGDLQVIAFDKTGTITSGEFVVTDVYGLNGATRETVLRIAASVEQQSNHPLAQAIVYAAQENNLEVSPSSGLENVAGKGVRSKIEGQPVLLGSLKLFQEADAPRPDDELVQLIGRLEAEGQTTVVVNHNSTFLGAIALADTPRATAGDVMQQLKDIGIKRLVMLTGDNDDVAHDIAKQVGLTDVQAELLPEDKLNVVKVLQKEHGSIAMVGDGVNDAPALATATVGIAMGGAGTAVALETADIALMADDLSKLPFAVGLSRASKRIIQQNLGISLGVIGLLIVSSVIGVVQLSGAVILHEGSTILVVLNALRLLGYRHQLER